MLAQDQSQFWSVMTISLIWFFSEATLYTLISFLADAFAYLWRKRLTRFIMDRYTDQQNFYWLQNLDNPDQRIAQDLSQWCTAIAKILKDLAAVPYGIVYYTYSVQKRLKSIKVLSIIYLWFIGGAILLK